jgi:hypothetical protein
VLSLQPGPDNQDSCPMLKIATNGSIDYHGSSSSSAAGTGNRLSRSTAARMTSSGWRNLTSFCHDDDDEGDYASMMTSSTTLSAEADTVDDCHSYESFAECGGGARKVPTSLSDLEVEDFDGIQLYEPVSSRHRGGRVELNRTSPLSGRNGNYKCQVFHSCFEIYLYLVCTSIHALLLLIGSRAIFTRPWLQWHLLEGVNTFIQIPNAVEI